VCTYAHTSIVIVTPSAAWPSDIGGSNATLFGGAGFILVAFAGAEVAASVI
jgi:hypothetical protein